MGKVTIIALRALLALIVLGGLATQFWLLPTWADQMAAAFPEVAWLYWPMLLVAWLLVVGVQVGLVAVWVLLGMVQRDRVFSTAAFRWVDVIIVAAVVDTLLVLGVFLLFNLAIGANPPGLMLTELALVVAGAAFALLMLVMKGLLRRACEATAELSVVI